MVDYTTTAKWGEAPTPPYSHIYIDTYNLIQHTPTKSSPHTATMFLFEKPSSLHLLFCFVEGYGEQLHVCVHVFFCFFFTTHIVVTMLGAWSLNLERDRETHTQRERGHCQFTYWH